MKITRNTPDLLIAGETPWLIDVDWALAGGMAFSSSLDGRENSI